MKVIGLPKSAGDALTWEAFEIHMKNSCTSPVVKILKTITKICPPESGGLKCFFLYVSCLLVIMFNSVWTTIPRQHFEARLMDNQQL